MVLASRRVPGVGVCVSWLVPGACSGVGWLVVGACGVWACVVGASVGVAWLVCVLWWFRILMCVLAFLFFLGFVFCLVNNGLPWVWCGGLRVCGVVVVVCCVFGVCACCLVVCALPWWVGLVCVAGRVVFAPVGYWVVDSCSFSVCSCARPCLVKGCLAKVSVGVCGCLGEGCVVGGGVVPVWLGVAVAGGGVGVSFDVGSRVFVLSGVSVSVSGSGASVSSPAASGSSLVGSLASECGGAIVSALVGSVSSPGSGSVVPVLPGAGVAASEFGSESAPVGSVSSLAPLSGSASVSSSGSVVAECGGVRVCAPCAARVFGDGWCFLVLRRWARAAGVDGARVSGLLSSSVDCVPGFGSLSAGSVPVSGSVPVASSPVSGGCVSASGSSRVGRVGVGFGARVRDWGVRVGVGGGVVSGGGVVASWWARARGRVSGLVSGVGVWVLVGLCGVYALVLVSVLVCFL